MRQVFGLAIRESTNERGKKLSKGYRETRGMRIYLKEKKIKKKTSKLLL